jgi:hypothetical protein
LCGASNSRCSWDEEPGEYRWIFHAVGDELQLRILWLDDNYPKQPDEEGRLVFETAEPISAIANTIADAAQRVLDKHGEDDYQKKWHEYPFPTATLQSLRERLTAGQSTN